MSTLKHVLVPAVLAALLAPLPALAQAPEGGEAPPAPPPPDMRRIRTLKVQFEREPTVAEVQKAALKAYRVHPDRVASYLRSASWKALAPELELIFNNEFGTNDRKLRDLTYLTMEKDNPAFPQKELERVTHGSISLGVRAHWSLSQLVFNAEVLDVTSLVGVQEGLLREITSLYFTRRRLMTSLILNPPQDPNEEITEQLRLEEVTASIDALTEGFFSREAKRRLAAAQAPAE